MQGGRERVMKKIIKEIKTFTCSQCHTKFESDEFKTYVDFPVGSNISRYIDTCPKCNNTVIISDYPDYVPVFPSPKEMKMY
jgi:uncharacterized CHY-type Zn-finger protein